MPTVLLIEDNPQNRYLVEFLLRQHGYRVLLAADGPEGIEAARRHRPDVILLDVQLPGMDGYAVARMLRGVPSLERTPIIAVTSHAMAGDRQRCLDAGCTGYIEKPIDPDSFVMDIQTLGAPVPMK